MEKKNKKWRKYVTNLISKVALTPMDFEEHVHKISIDDICTIMSLKSNGFNMSEEAIPSEINSYDNRKCSAHTTTESS